MKAKSVSIVGFIMEDCDTGEVRVEFGIPLRLATGVHP